MTKYLYICCFAFLLISCDKQVNLDLPSTPNQLVINSLFNDETPISIYMTSTVNPRDTVYGSTTKDLIISLFENNVFKEVVSFNQSTQIYQSTVVPKAGHTYRLGVKRGLNQTDEVTVQTSMPQPFKLSNVSFTDSAVQTGNDYYGELKFTINDASGFDFYKLIIYYYNGSAQSFIPLDYKTSDAVLNDDSTLTENTERYFSDRLFKYKSHEFKVLVQSGSYYYLNNRNLLMIESASLSPEYYQYMTSLRDFDKSYDPKDPLNNPVQLYSNTSNKVGIFAGYIQNRDTIR